MSDLYPPVQHYQRRPEASRIEAVQFDGTGEMASQILRWANQSNITTSTSNAVGNENGTDWKITIHPSEGDDSTMIAVAGDWLAKGVLGQVYTLPADILASTYEPVDSE